jgi:hypothetical protein
MKVYTTNGGRYVGHTPTENSSDYRELSEDEAASLASNANKKAEKLGISTRYEVKE